MERRKAARPASGPLVRLTHEASRFTVPSVFIMEERGFLGRVLFAVAGNTQRHLRVGPNGSVDLNGGQGPWAQFVAEGKTPVDPQFGGGWTTFLRSIGNEGKTNRYGGKNWYLGVTPTGDLIGNASNDISGQWRILEVPENERNVLMASLKLNSSNDIPWFDEARFSQEQIDSFLNHGYTQVKGLVAKIFVDNALKIINNQLGKPDGGMIVNEMGQPALSGSVQSSKEVLDLLYRTPVYTLAQRLIGKDKVAPVQQGQIALRFPELNPPPLTLSGTQWHIDGFGQGLHSPFTLLVGVTLSSCSEKFAGNLCVFPGSHLSLQEEIKRQVKEGSNLFSTEIPIDTQNNGPIPRKPDLGPPVQILADPGDVVFLHQKLAHRVGINASPNIRYQIYFRLRHKRHEELKDQALDNIWLEYEGLYII